MKKSTSIKKTLSNVKTLQYYVKKNKFKFHKISLRIIKIPKKCNNSSIYSLCVVLVLAFCLRKRNKIHAKKREKSSLQEAASPSEYGCRKNFNI